MPGVIEKPRSQLRLACSNIRVVDGLSEAEHLPHHRLLRDDPLPASGRTRNEHRRARERRPVHVQIPRRTPVRLRGTRKRFGREREMPRRFLGRVRPRRKYTR